MNNKNKSIILTVFIILSLQILLLINNKQKTSFRYFIWNVEEVSLGSLICISFISGLSISYSLNKTLNNDIKITQNDEENDNSATDKDYSLNTKNNDGSYEMPPERDLRDIQPTISVNYRVIKDNSENELKNRSQSSQNIQYQDDWDNNDSEW